MDWLYLILTGILGGIMGGMGLGGGTLLIPLLTIFFWDRTECCARNKFISIFTNEFVCIDNSL